MACAKKGGTIHSGLCDINYPHKLVGGKKEINATKKRDCTLDKGFAKEVRTVLGYEEDMDLVSPLELARLDPKTVFGTYCQVQKGHFCVDFGRRTVDGRRLGWLWVFPDGKAKPSNKMFAEPPPLVWSIDEILDAFQKAGNDTLSMWTRHEEKYSELAITFCLPLPK